MSSGNELGRTLLVLRLLWFAFLSSVAILAMVAHLALADVSSPADSTVVVGLAVVAVMIGVSSFAARRVLVDGPLCSGSLDFGKPADAQRYLSGHLVVWALCETVGVLGLVLHVLGGDDGWSLGLFLLSFLLLLVHGPRQPVQGGGAASLARPGVEIRPG